MYIVSKNCRREPDKRKTVFVSVFKKYRLTFRSQRYLRSRQYREASDSITEYRELTCGKLPMKLTFLCNKFYRSSREYTVFVLIAWANARAQRTGQGNSHGQLPRDKRLLNRKNRLCPALQLLRAQLPRPRPVQSRALGPDPFISEAQDARIGPHSPAISRFGRIKGTVKCTRSLRGLGVI